MRKGIRPSHSLAQIKGARLELNSVNVNYSYFATVECIGNKEGYPPPSLSGPNKWCQTRIKKRYMVFILNIVYGCYCYMASCTN